MRTRVWQKTLLSVSVALAVFASVAALSSDSARADGIGVFPTNMVFDNAFRGGDYFRTVGVINTGDRDREFTFEALGNLADWVQFVDPIDRNLLANSISAPAGGEGRVLLKLTVPEAASNGLYEGSVRVMALVGSADSAETSAGVSLGAELSLEINVSGEQIIDGALLDLSSVKQVEQGSPIRLKSAIRNDGNVRVEPVVSLLVRDGEGSAIFQGEFDNENQVYPGEIQEIVTEWDTTGLELGDYSASVSLRYADVEFGERNTSFSIVEVGALTLGGELMNVSLSTEAVPFAPVKLKGEFRNIGQRDALAKLKGEVYRESTLIGVFEEDGILVPVGEQRTLVAFAELRDPGSYVIRGVVNYGVGDRRNETEPQEVAFVVNPYVDQSAASQVQANAAVAEAQLQAETTGSPGALRVSLMDFFTGDDRLVLAFFAFGGVIILALMISTLLLLRKTSANRR